MKKEIRQVDEKRGILQVTTVDERWYIRDMKDAKTGLPKYEYVPSVTWICEHYPKGVAFYKWLASKGWNEAEAIKTAAGDKGSKVHEAIEDLIKGKEISIDAKYMNYSTKKDEELNLEEYECIMSFASWWQEVKPKPLGFEFAVWGDGYAGTVDLLCSIEGKTWLIDFKTSQYIWPSHELQVSAYKHAMESKDVPANINLAILQLGYRLNEKRFKFTEIEDQYAEFQAAKTIWAKEQKGVEPKQREYPLIVTLKGE
jgi:hypothetical protein